MARTSHNVPCTGLTGVPTEVKSTVLLIALAFENCVDLAHAPLAVLYSDFVWGLCGSKVTRKTQPFKRKCM